MQINGTRLIIEQSFKGNFAADWLAEFFKSFRQQIVSDYSIQSHELSCVVITKWIRHIHGL